MRGDRSGPPSGAARSVPSTTWSSSRSPCVIGLGLGLSRAPAGAHSVRPRVEQIPLLGVGAALYAASALLDGSPATLCLRRARSPCSSPSRRPTGTSPGWS